VASSLGEIGAQAKAAVPALTEALKDDDANVRQAAAGALKKITGDEIEHADKRR
jgi:HEAT repeat protein